MTNIKRLFKPPSQSYFLFGPRGTGKSTWVNEFYPNALRIDLLDDNLFRSYSADPNRLLGVVRSCPPGHTVIIDEVQQVPALLSLVHILIEEKNNWIFVLTGSSSRKLKRAGVDLLGGRALLCTFHPFLLAEMPDNHSMESALGQGLLPLVVSAQNPQKTLAAYAGLYLREEVQREGMVRNIGDFSRFLEIMAFSHGAPLNISHLSREVQVKRGTVNSYVQILEDLLLSFFVPLFTRRAKRELAGHPKFYYFDAGVFRSLRRRGPFDREEEIDGQALEGLVAQHLRAWNSYGDGDQALYYWRTRWGVEVDFVLYGPGGLWAIEVKNTDRLRRDDMKGLNVFLDDYPEARAFFLYRGKERWKEGRLRAMPCEDFLRYLKPGVGLETIFQPL